MLLQWIPTQVHGVLDYMTSAMMVTIPRVMGWGPAPTRVLDIAAGGATAYSLATDYELGVSRRIPMPAHLAMDAVSGAGLIFAAAYLLDDEDADVRGTIAAIGAFELLVALTTKIVPSPSRRRRRRADPSSPLLGEEDAPGGPIRLTDPLSSTAGAAAPSSGSDIAVPT